ncbi:MAG: competence/damage-inducible protein A, partial [Candidatus Omnitrophica bacterium]|nr:competence/damage-inducible protein A [Candidatus Omnitrophota bacterium]
MKAEIIGIGTEILLGHIINTNSAYLSRQLASIGIDVYYHTTV